jgi:NhaP-type Na+/H+ or K+/H+ antiporter
MSATGEDAIDIVWEFVAYLLTAVVFLEVGLAISPGRLLDSIGPIEWAIAAILVGRAAMIVYLLPGRGLTSHPTPQVGGARPSRLAPRPLLVGSPRGVAVAMALSLPVDIPQRDLLQEITFGAGSSSPCWSRHDRRAN